AAGTHGDGDRQVLGQAALDPADVDAVGDVERARLELGPQITDRLVAHARRYLPLLTPAPSAEAEELQDARDDPRDPHALVEPVVEAREPCDALEPAQPVGGTRGVPDAEDLERVATATAVQPGI